MAYLGNQPALSYTSFAKQDFTTSATTSYTLDNPVTNANELALFINFVRQEPTTAYSASGTSLTLTSATSATDDMYCVFLGKAVQTVNPPNGSVGNSQTAPTIITGQTAETSIATDDTILIHDTSAGALKKMTRANFVSGVGGDNTPAFHVRLSGNQTLSHDTLTRIAWDTEVFDTDNAFASNVFTVPTGEGGKYVFSYCVFGDDSDDTDTYTAYIEVDGTQNADSNTGLASPRTGQNMILRAVTIITLTEGQVVEVVAKHQGTNQSEVVRSSGSFFSGYKLIGV